MCSSHCWDQGHQTCDMKQAQFVFISLLRSRTLDMWYGTGTVWCVFISLNRPRTLDMWYETGTIWCVFISLHRPMTLDMWYETGTIWCVFISLYRLRTLDMWYETGTIWCVFISLHRPRTLDVWYEMGTVWCVFISLHRLTLDMWRCLNIVLQVTTTTVSNPLGWIQKGVISEYEDHIRPLFYLYVLRIITFNFIYLCVTLMVWFSKLISI